MRMTMDVDERGLNRSTATSAPLLIAPQTNTLHDDQGGVQSWSRKEFPGVTDNKCLI